MAFNSFFPQPFQNEFNYAVVYSVFPLAFCGFKEETLLQGNIW